MKKITLILITISLIPIFAIEDTKENREKQATRYLETTPPNEILQQIAAEMAKNVPEEKQAKFKELITQHLDIKALSLAMKNAMVSHFTADELEALGTFYSSEVGKSAMKKFNDYMNDIIPAIEKEMYKAYTKAKKAKK